MHLLRRIPVFFAVAAIALIFAVGGSTLVPSTRSVQNDESLWDAQLADLIQKQQHALPGSAEHYKYGHKINRILAHREGRPLQENPDLFAQALYDRTVPADRDFAEYEPGYRVRELNKAKTRLSPLKAVPLPWINRGPGNVAGRARAIVVDPGDATNNTWYFGSVGGGIWKTTDAGVTWADLTPDFPVLSVQSLAQAASNPDVMYAGTGESFYNVDTIHGNGILKSTDRGATWTHLASTINDVDFHNVSRIIIDPTNPDIVVCSTTTGRYKQSLNPESHIFKSTDGGANWTAVYTETDLGTYDRVKKIQQVIADPTNFNKQYAAISEKGILVSTDAGDTWTLSNSGISDFRGRFELAISPANTNYVYAAAEGTDHSELYVSSDGGATWNETFESGTEPNWLGAQGWYDNCIVAHPFDTDIVYVGGIRLWRIDLNGTNRTTTQLSQGSVHVDEHYLVVLNDSGGAWRLLNSNDGGVGVTTSGDTGWYAPKDGMITTQFYGVDKAPGRDAYSGGMQDNGTWHSVTDPSALDFWSFDIGGDGYETHWHFNDPLKMMGGFQYNGIQRSLDGGQSWSSAIGPIDYGSGNAPFITKIASSHESPDDVYAVGASGVWHSSDFGGNWTLASIAYPEWSSVSSFMDVRVSQADADIVWAGARMDADGLINVSTDRGATFHGTTIYPDVTMGGISGIATHPTQPNTAYALFSFAERPKILRTEDLGVTWTDLSGFGTGTVSTNGFPDVAVYDLVVFPDDPNRIWVGTEIGLIESLDNGATWAMADNGLPNVGIWQLHIVEDEVVVASHGRGVWSVEIPSLIVGSTFNPLLESLYQPPSGDLIIDVNLRSAADSTQLWMDGSVYQTLPANAAKYTESIAVPVLTSGTRTIFLRSFIGGSGYDSVTKSVEVLALPNPAYSYVNDFESGGSDFTGLGSGTFEVRSNSGFAGQALHSPHDYQNGETLVAVLAQPIQVAAANATVSFDEVAIVEPGNSGTLYGDSSFWDYVIVEGSLDGATWVPLGPGYDARQDSDWLNAYNSGSNGDSSMFRSRSYNLLDTFAAQDIVLLRFRLYADGYVNSWGWVIDNLSIQENAATPVNNVPAGRFALNQNHPNPFNPTTTIAFELPHSGHTSLKVFNLRGQLIRTLVDGRMAEGPNQVVWDGKDRSGASVASGTYLYQLKSGDLIQQKKMLLLK